MAIQHLDSQSFNEVISSGVVLVDFWAAWCGPCQRIAPILEQLDGEFEGKATIAKVNVDEQGDLAAKYGVMSIPTLKLFKDGQEVGTKVGLRSQQELSDFVSEFI